MSRTAAQIAADAAELRALLESMPDEEEKPAEAGLSVEEILAQYEGPKRPAIKYATYACEECGVLRTEPEAVVRLDGRICGLNCAADVLEAARELLSDASRTAAAVLAMDAAARLMLPAALSAWAERFTVPLALQPAEKDSKE